ncbi:UNVERIFIED_CONTAM: hypothetical protein Scaly_2364900 [Sesamum calycinum]|uniref:Protein FAM33A n=1 Tax=Sesamum calycinum TaxID=2727403 RepID=A0AAW2M060_9LAMI
MEHNQAVDGLLNLFSKANRDLSTVHNKLHKEFQQVYPDHANPMKLVARLKKIEEEMSSLKDQCRELLVAKQDLIDKARTLLVGNRTLLQRLQESSGAPVTSDADDPVFCELQSVRLCIICQQATKIYLARFYVMYPGIKYCATIIDEQEFGLLTYFSHDVQIIDEWTLQVKSKTVEEQNPPKNGIHTFLKGVRNTYLRRRTRRSQALMISTSCYSRQLSKATEPFLCLQRLGRSLVEIQIGEVKEILSTGR